MKKGECRCGYEKLYRKLWSRYMEEIVLIVNPKCPLHGEIKDEATRTFRKN